MSKVDHIIRMWKLTKASFIFAELVAVCITLSALADCVFHLGWGYNWKAVAGGVGIMAWGVVVYRAGRSIFRWTSNIYK